MPRYTSFRLPDAVPRLRGRSPDAYAQELQDFLEKLFDKVVGGIPAGFNDIPPSNVEAGVTPEPGDVLTGWSAADHHHLAPTDIPVAVGVELAESEGSAFSLTRSDHRHKVEAWRTFGLVIDRGVGPVNPGFKGYVACPFSGTITQWYLEANQVGSCVLDVWKSRKTPTAADTICGSGKPTLSSQISATGPVSGWTNLSVLKGDVVGFNVDSASSLTRITLVVRVMES